MRDLNCGPTSIWNTTAKHGFIPNGPAEIMVSLQLFWIGRMTMMGKQHCLRVRIEMQLTKRNLKDWCQKLQGASDLLWRN